jgi:diguanylate cyclase (GGDEF)-like protein
MRIESRIATIRAAAQAKEYRETADDRRFQAVERHRLRTTGRAGMLIIMLVAVLGGSLLSVVQPAAPGLVVGLDSVLSLTAAAAYWLLGGRLRHYPEFLIFVVASAVILACVALGLLVSELAVLAAGYLLLIPVVVSQVVTWRTWTHTVWLVLYVVAVMAFLVMARVGDLSQPEKIDIAVLAMISIVVSFCGHVVGIRGRIRGFRQLRTIQSLHRSIERQAALLKRQAADLTGALAELERTSRVDPLTRIANRLRLDEDFEEVRARINRTGETFGLLEADLDRFKAVNDQLGHLAGDAVLRLVAQALQGALRAGDHVYRYGGEEFIVFVAGADALATRAAAERLRAAVEALAIAHPDPQLGRVTVSIGGTVIGPADIDATDGALFDRADRAMYAAKTNGRNQVAIELPGWYGLPPAGAALVPADGTA